MLRLRAISSAVEHSLHTGGVAGSIPASPTIQSCQSALVSGFEETAMSSMACGTNAICTRDLADLHVFNGWKRPRVSGGTIPFPKVTDALFRKAAGYVERCSDIAILLRVGGRDLLTFYQL